MSREKLTRLIREALPASREGDDCEDGWTQQRCLVSTADLRVLETVLFKHFSYVDVRLGVDEMIVLDLACAKVDAEMVNGSCATSSHAGGRGS